MSAVVVDDKTLVERVAADRAAGRTVAFANGCFDLLHVGHVRYLEGAKREGDRLIVAINDDASVRRLKGDDRPILPATARAELVAALRAADYVVVFPDETVERLLRLVRPDVHCKGTDYTVDSVPERAVMASLGGRIAIVGDPKDHSTAQLLEKLSQDTSEGRSTSASTTTGSPAAAPAVPTAARVEPPEPFFVWLVAHRRVPLGFLAAIVAYWFATSTPTAIAIGCLVALPGQALRIWGAGHLQKARVVTASGPYRFMRHPLYIGSSIMGVGFAIASGSIVSALVTLAYLAITIPVTARREEQSLDRNLGGAYTAYRSGQGGDVARPFSWAQVHANHEWRSIAGFAIAIGLLVVRMYF